LDVPALKASIAYVVERHESLRTRIVLSADIPHQDVDPTHRTPNLLGDLEHVVSVNTEVSAQNVTEEFFEQRIDLTVGPLFGAKLLRRSDTEHVLLLAIDHVVSDAVSNTILNKDIWSAYPRIRQGGSPSLPPLPIQFPDYALWRHQNRETDTMRHEPFWTRRLTGARRVEIPADLPDGRLEADVSGELAHYPLGKRLSDALRTLAKEEHLLLPGLVLALYARAMSEWCQTEDILLGFVSHGRHGRPELENMMGCLARTLYVRLSLSPSEPMIDLARRTNQELLSALQHEDFVPALPAEQATEVLFSWGGLPVHSTRWTAGTRQSAPTELRLQPFPVRSRWSHKLLTFFSDTPAGIVLTASYRPDLLKQDSIARFGRNLQRFGKLLVETVDA
jgi:hypothetical protein